MRHELPLYSDRGGDLWIINTLLAFYFILTGRNAHITTSTDMKPFLVQTDIPFYRLGMAIPQAAGIFYTPRKPRSFLRLVTARSHQQELVDIGFTLDAPTAMAGIPDARWLGFGSLGHN